MKAKYKVGQTVYVPDGFDGFDARKIKSIVIREDVVWYRLTGGIRLWPENNLYDKKPK